MKFRTLISRSLRYHWRSHLGVVLGAAIGSAALIGALVVGDSVRGSLRKQSLQRLGKISFAMETGDRFFTTDLASELPCDYKDTWTIEGDLHGVCFGGSCAVLALPGTARHQDGRSRANHVNLLGVWQQEESERGNHYYDLLTLANWKAAPYIKRGEVFLNEALAVQLGARVGDEVLFRIQKPTALAGDAAIVQRSQSSAALRLKMAKILGANELGNFGLRPSAAPPLNAFLNLSELQETVDLAGRANLIVTGPIVENNWSQPNAVRTALDNATQKLESYHVPLMAEFHSLLTGGDYPERKPEEAVAELQFELGFDVTLADCEATLTNAPGNETFELRSRRVFLDQALANAALTNQSNAQPILTYLATLITAGVNATPYSMVTAAGAPWTPKDLADDEVVVNQWLADDLNVKPGDQIKLSYFLPESGVKLQEVTNTFRVHSVVAMDMPWADRTLMPDFPGIENAESTSEWDAGFPLTYEIRKKDDDYWKQYRGTPKAFVTLTAGQKMWGNRFGSLTMIRYPKPADYSGTNFLKDVDWQIRTNLDIAALGFQFKPVREQALKAAAGSQDFGGLFLGFSFFLIAAALLLMAMLFRFGLEQRAPEIGTLLALGFAPKQVRKLLLREGLVLSLLGGIFGAVGGILFARTMLQGLTTVWQDAVGGTTLEFFVTAQTLLIGLCSSVLVCGMTIWWTLRKFVHRPARELLVGEIENPTISKRRNWRRWWPTVALAGAVGLIVWAISSGDTTNAGVFFGAGTLLLVAGTGFLNNWLAARERPDESTKSASTLSFSALAIRGCVRRRKRSLATIIMIASGSFLITSIGVFRLDANRDATAKTSGTGGFALLGETTLPVLQDLNSPAGRDFFALDQSELKGVRFVSFRVRAGDEASCLNLNAAQQPKLLGVNPSELEDRFTFAKVLEAGVRPSPWLALTPGKPYPKTAQPLAENEVAAIGDANSIQWAMKKKVGDTIDYVNERGQPFKVRIVGAVANSILQGKLLISEREFIQHFPTESGYQMFLIDAPSNRVKTVSADLTRALEDVGLELTPTAVRLNQFNAVQNTYLGTFQALGGLGLLLGSVGLGIVVLRNVLERRSELAVLLAVGFRKRAVQRLVLLENGALLIAGLVLGVCAAGIAVLPSLVGPETHLPSGSLGLTLLAVMLNGLFWTWAATRFAVRGDLLTALRND